MYILSAAIVILLLSACTQEAAPVAYKGGEFYGRGNEQASINSSMHSHGFDASYSETHYSESAPSAGVGVNDLQPVQMKEIAPLPGRRPL